MKATPGAVSAPKMGDMSPILKVQNSQHPDFFDSHKESMGDVSPTLLRQAQSAALQRDLLEAVRQNDDLRVEVERLRMDIERRDARIAEPERLLAEALTPQGGQALLDKGRAAAG